MSIYVVSEAGLDMAYISVPSITYLNISRTSVQYNTKSLNYWEACSICRLLNMSLANVTDPSFPYWQVATSKYQFQNYLCALGVHMASNLSQ